MSGLDCPAPTQVGDLDLGGSEGFPAGGGPAAGSTAAAADAQGAWPGVGAEDILGGVELGVDVNGRNVAGPGGVRVALFGVQHGGVFQRLRGTRDSRCGAARRRRRAPVLGRRPAGPGGAGLPPGWRAWPARGRRGQGKPDHNGQQLGTAWARLRKLPGRLVSTEATVLVNRVNHGQQAGQRLRGLAAAFGRQRPG